MLSPESYVELALIEYKRDPEFRKHMDRITSHLVEQGHLEAGTPLEATLARAVEGGRPLAWAVLRAFHNQSSQPQWQRARALMSGAA